MTRRNIAAAATVLALAGSLVACSGDDSDEPGDEGTGAAGTVETAGPEEPETIPGACPLTAKQVQTWLGGKVKGKNCSYATTSPQTVLSITTAAADDAEAFDAARSEVEEKWANFEEISVPGEGYAAWSEDELNIVVGYRDNASAYRFVLTAITPDLMATEDVPELAEQLVDLTVKNRPEVG